MKNAIHLSNDLMQNKGDFVDALVKRFKTLIHATEGGLSGTMIWRNFYHGLNINIEKEILDAFDINNLEDIILGIKSVVLYKDPSTYETFLLFNIGNGDEKVSTRDTAEAFAKDISDIYAYINKIETNSQLKANIEVTIDSASVSFPKDDPVEHDIVNNVFDSVRAVYKGLNNIKSETGVKTGVAITGLGVHFDFVKDKLGFSISVEKKELDNAADMRMPIKNTLETAIKKIMD
mgnify:CR=1 FL=1